MGVLGQAWPMSQGPMTRRTRALRQAGGGDGVEGGDWEGGVAHAPADGTDELALVKVDRVRLL